MAVLEGGRSTRDQNPFLIKAAYSACIAENQEGSVKAAFVDFGSRWIRSRVGFTLGLNIPDLMSSLLTSHKLTTNDSS